MRFWPFDAIALLRWQIDSTSLASFSQWWPEMDAEHENWLAGRKGRSWTQEGEGEDTPGNIQTPELALMPLS